MPTGQTYDKTFKQEAVRLVHSSRKLQREVAEDLGVFLALFSKHRENAVLVFLMV